MMTHGNGRAVHPVCFFVPHHSRRAKVGGLLLALSLGAAACGTDDTTSADADSSTPTESTDTTEAPPSSSDDAESDPADDDSASAEESADDPADDPVAEADETADDGEESAAQDPADETLDEPASTADNVFPNLDVLDIATGSTVNLSAELAGGDTPVLLWFWAPH